ncbi:MAG: LytTR family transcriptional regulator [Acidobacteria bacterium]|nr:LytTR family transcriptional regulator [Acidobacteriota bacterium]
MGSRRFLLHLEDGLREAVEIDDIYYLEAREGDKLVRLRRKKPKIDRRRFEVIVPMVERAGLLRVYREYVVNVDRIRFLRLRDGSREWEIVLDPPVNAVIPVSRQHYPRLMRTFKE